MKFRTAQILALVSILLITVAIVGVMSYRNSVFALRELSAQILEQTSQRVDQHINATLDVAVAQSTVYENLLTNGSIDTNDHVAMSQHFLGSMRANPQLSYLSFATENGEYWHVFRRTDGGLEVQYFLREEDFMTLTDFRVLPDGKLQQLRQTKRSKRTDPRTRPYYVRAKKVGKQTWTQTYLFLGSGGTLNIPGVTRATPVYADGKLKGVLTADFDLAALSKFLETLSVGKTGFAFIVELRRPSSPATRGERRVIGHPRPELLVAAVDPTDPSKGQDAIPGDKIADERVRGFLRKLPRDLQSRAGKSLTEVTLGVNGKQFIGGYRRLGDHDLSWVICMMMPEDDVMGSVHANARTTVLIVLIGIVVAIIVSLFLSSAIAKTLRELADESQSIGEFQLEAGEPRQSYLLEIRQLAVALEEMKRSLRSFKKFVPADIVRSLLASGKEAELGGERQEICVFFCDIASFTSIAEDMPPDELVELLGEFLGAMSEEIITSGGTVDKYIGDAIMAFWGAPKAVDNPALTACQVALACHKRLDSLNESWRGRKWPTISMRIGLHLGEAIVGNFGSEQRLDYTAIGDAVNLTSRIEGLNKYYGTACAMSDQTLQVVQQHVVTRPLDRVSVKGRDEGVLIHELIGLRSEVSKADAARAQRHAQALDAYFDGDFAVAQERLEALHAARTTDRAVDVLLERVRVLVTNPPPSWDGIHRMTQK